MYKTISHKADTRGQANHGWLKARHTFSFAGYFNPERHHFGALRVLNDDKIEAGMGFGTHPHENMEIITLPLYGELQHADSMGNSSIIKSGDIQVMSAGTGIEHSEINPRQDQPLALLQIWIFPNKKNVEPRYQQITLDPVQRVNRLQQILSPNSEDDGVWIYQNAWFHLGKLEEGIALDYDVKQKGNGVYAFLITGNVSINGVILDMRDGLAIQEAEVLNIKSNNPYTELLLMEVPMAL